MNRDQKGRLAVGISTATITGLMAPIVRGIMIRSKVMDVPNGRSSHKNPVPRGGGWACILGAAGGLVAARVAGQHLPWKTVIGACALGFVGFLDDRWNLPAAPRLVAQCAVGGVSGSGARSSVLGAAVVPSVVNAVNFMDGINGITALTAAVWGVNAALTGSNETKLIGVVTAGSALGFLPHNFRRERLFLGDVGSYFIGGLIGTSAMSSTVTTRQRLNICLPIAIYAADTGFTLLRRCVRRESLLEAHRDHTYQKLVHGAGLAHWQVAVFASSSAALVTWRGRKRDWVSVVAIIAAYLTSPVWVKRRPQARIYPRCCD